MRYKIIKPSEDEIKNESLKFRFHSEEKQCVICHSSFNYGFLKTKTCGLCKLLVKCDLCEEWFEYKFSISGRGYYFDKELIQNIIFKNTHHIKLNCFSCIEKSNPGLCSVCKVKNVFRDGSNRGRSECSCSSIWYQKHNSSEIMRKASSRNAIKYLAPLREKYKNGGNCVICDTYNDILDQCGRGKTHCECSKESYKKIGIKQIAYMPIRTAPGICGVCSRDTKNDNPPTKRTAACVCMKCQSVIALKASKLIKVQILSGKRKYWPGSVDSNFFENKWCKKCDKETPHNESGVCLKCVVVGVNISYCEVCKKDTYHNGKVCGKCYPKSLFIIKNIIINKFCDKCKIETPHNIDDECQICETHEKIWCNHCNKWETIKYNLIDLHWIFYKSKTNTWIKDFPHQVQSLENNIIGINKLQNDAISGIYCWLINHKPFYIGKSTDILCRSYDHMFEMYNSPQYWDNIVNNFDKNTLEIKVLEECKPEIINGREMYWINKLKPSSQKCNGTDAIKSLEERENSRIII